MNWYHGRLQSKFRLTYSMILNLLRVEQLRVEDMMKRSFAELDTQKQQAGHKERADKLRKELDELEREDFTRLKKVKDQNSRRAAAAAAKRAADEAEEGGDVLGAFEARDADVVV